MNKCRFTVEQGKCLLEKAGLKNVGLNLENLPEPSDFDEEHKKWRNAIIRASEEGGLNFTHGVAAKLINIYLKSIYVCSNEYNNEKVKAIHPPIDSVLLDALYKENVAEKKDKWQAARKVKWSKFNCRQYQEVIDAIKTTISKERGLWEIEEHWQGYQ